MHSSYYMSILLYCVVSLLGYMGRFDPKGELLVLIVVVVVLVLLVVVKRVIGIVVLLEELVEVSVLILLLLVVQMERMLTLSSRMRQKGLTSRRMIVGRSRGCEVRRTWRWRRRCQWTMERCAMTFV